MIESHEYEMNKLQKQNRILNSARSILYPIGMLMFILVFLEVFDIIDLPFIEIDRARRAKIFINSWVGVPVLFIEKKLSKNQKRIKEINALYSGDSKYF